jgi:hypothetical protein
MARNRQENFTPGKREHLCPRYKAGKMRRCTKQCDVICPTSWLVPKLIASCQIHGLEPWAYLRDLLCAGSGIGTTASDAKQAVWPWSCAGRGGVA